MQWLNLRGIGGLKTGKDQDDKPTGAVFAHIRSAQIQTVASAVPNVQQVLNELQVKNQKATSSN